MKLCSTALIYQDDNLKILDQRELPHQEKWIAIKNPDEMCEAIQTLAVRGAPLIGVAAALSLAQLARQNAASEIILLAAKKLKQVRPTAVNLMHCIDRVVNAFLEGGRNSLIQCAHDIFWEDKKLCDDIANASRSLVRTGDRILTICNSGGLATAGIGTALGVMYQAFCRDNKDIRVYACETRPLLQGARLTTWELAKNKIPHTLICDSMAAHLMSQHKIDKIFVGSDRIAKNGDAANKIGTYSLAVLAHYHQIPFYVVAPYTTVDLQAQTGKDIVIEQRNPEEIKGVKGAFGTIQWAPKNTAVDNPAFDVTPNALITGFVFNNGFFETGQFNHFDDNLINVTY